MKKFSLFVSLGFLLYLLWFAFETSRVMDFQYDSWTESQSADCGVVLTGAPGRLLEALSLLNQKRINKLIVSGVHPQAQLHEIFPQLPFYGSVESENIILEKFSKTTYGNAQQSSALISALECKSSILITSDIHMYRSYWTFVGNLPQDYPLYKRSVPTVQSSRTWYLVLLEVLKAQFYRLWAY